MAAHNLVPEVLWAQRAGEVYLTINLSDVQNEVVDLEEEKLHFKGESNGKTYEVTLEFSKPVDPAVRRCVSLIKRIPDTACFVLSLIVENRARSNPSPRDAATLS